MSIVNKLTAGLGLALTLSLIANIGAGYVYLQQRDALVISGNNLEHKESETVTARAAADTCSASVEALVLSAAVMASQLESLRLAAQQRAAGHFARADKILSMPAAVPGDACASAQKRVSEILATRPKGGG